MWEYMLKHNIQLKVILHFEEAPVTQVLEYEKKEASLVKKSRKKSSNCTSYSVRGQPFSLEQICTGPFFLYISA